MVCCSDSEYKEEVMTGEDDKAEEQITGGEVQEDSDQGSQCDEHDSASIILLLIIHGEKLSLFHMFTFIPRKTFTVSSFYKLL